MTSRFVMSSAVAAIITMQALSADPPSAPGALLAIAYSFGASRSDDAVRGMQAELSHLLIDSNVKLRWFERIKGDGLYVDGRILVVNIVGSCEPVADTRATVNGEALAWNQITDGHFQPFVTVDCRRVAAFVAREIRGAGEPASDKLVGRAIARVIAHEMYHFFTRTRRHSRSSTLFRGALHARDLVEDGVEFQPEEIENLEHGIETPCDCEN